MASLQKRTVKGIDYWSLVESKRINGKPRPVVIEYFGNTKNFAKKLEMLLNGESKIIKSYSHGDTYALMKIAERLGLEQILDRAFKPQSRSGLTRSRSLLLIALQSICNPSSKSGFESWIKSTTMPYDYNIPADDLNSNHFWEQMENITVEELAKAESAIVQKIFKTYGFELEKIVLDYTNYFSYISSSNIKSELAKRGHNKQKRNDLRQYSLALITTKESGLPLYSHIYEGNKNDKSVFPEYLEILKERIPNYDPKAITMIFDGGSNTKENFEKLETHYVCSFSLNSCKELYDIDLSEYNDIQLKNCIVRGFRTTHNIWGVERECILTYSPSLYTGQVKELDKDICTAIEAFRELNEKLENPKSRIKKDESPIKSKIKKILSAKHMDFIFETSIIFDANGKCARVEHSVVESAKEAIKYKFFGKKLLITDQQSWTTSEIIQAYREQDCIEKIFRSTKNHEHCSIRPQYHFTDQKIRVHIFCCLLGLTLATVLHQEITDRGFNASKYSILDILHSIRRCWLKDSDSNRVTKVLEVMDDTQSSLWNIVQSL